MGREILVRVQQAPALLGRLPRGGLYDPVTTLPGLSMVAVAQKCIVLISATPLTRFPVASALASAETSLSNLTVLNQHAFARGVS